MDRTDVLVAADRIRGRVRTTPVFHVGADDDVVPAGSVLKLEQLQHTGTFKVRGAFNRVLAAGERGELDPDVGIVVASGGNAGVANEYVAAALGVPATVFVPVTSSPAKVSRLADHGATVVRHGEEYAEAYDAALEHVARTGAVLCHAYDQLEVCAGAGTVAFELLDHLDTVAVTVDTVLVAVGGGGLMAGIACAVEDRVRVVAVEPERAPTLRAARDAGRPVDVAVGGVAADALGARRLGTIAWQTVQRSGVTSVLVDDDALLHARREMWNRYRLVSEVGAAAPFAALASGRYTPEPGERVAVVVCGANTDPADLSHPPPAG